MTDDANLQAEFERFDADKSGYIDENEFAALVSSLGSTLSRQKVAVAFLAIDINGNGRIEFGEFRSWWSKYQVG